MNFKLQNGTNFDTDKPACPQCNGKMYDNRGNKKSPKHPDFRCMAEDCKDESGYRTGVYIPKDLKKQSDDELASKKSKGKSSSEGRAGGGLYDSGTAVSMFAAWAKDISIYLADKNGIKSADEFFNLYKDVLTRTETILDTYCNQFANKHKPPVSQQERQVGKPAPAPESQDLGGGTELPDPLAEIEKDLGGSGLDAITPDDLSGIDL